MLRYLIFEFCLFSKDYRADKKRIFEARLLEKEKKKDNIRKKIIPGALLELSGLPPIGMFIYCRNSCEVFTVDLTSVCPPRF